MQVIDAEQEKHDIAQFTMASDDCTLHHLLTLHGAPGNTNNDERWRAYEQRSAGDDITCSPGPNLRRMLPDTGIPIGAPLDSDLFRVI